MNRLLEVLKGCLSTLPETDRHLLDRFLAARDEAAFAELVRRHGRVVWGVCHRRLANHHDAEDAFQATFLVLIRRAAKLSRDIPLGPWLHRVAVMTTRNVVRGNRRRTAVSGPMEHEVPAPESESNAERLDLDAALLALPERLRRPIVLCHLQGLSRREAAAQLGYPEGTLSSLLNKAMVRLRAKLGASLAALLAVAALSVPAGVASATVRVANIVTTSTLTAAGVSPAVIGLTDGVLRMFWLKKIAAGFLLVVLVAGGLFAGLVGRSEGLAQQLGPTPLAVPDAPEDPDAALRRLEKQIDNLRKQREALGEREKDLFAEKEKLEETKKAKAMAVAVAELGNDIAVVLTQSGHSYAYTIREVVNGKVAVVQCYDLDMLTTYLKRVLNDPKGPKKIRVSADKNHSVDHLKQVFAACATAGYTKASYSVYESPVYTIVSKLSDSVRAAQITVFDTVTVEPPPQPGEIDLTNYGKPKKP
jgi:RNA polymerase sigma factor (sigma-70 family)